MEPGFFVGVYDPLDVKRNLLESSKQIIKSLQSYEVLGEIRKEKLAEYRRMREVMAELNVLMARLNEKLPKSHLRKANEHEAPLKRLDMPKLKFTDQLTELEKQLKNIERELTALK